MVLNEQGKKEEGSGKENFKLSSFFFMLIKKRIFLSIDIRTDVDG